MRPTSLLVPVSLFVGCDSKPADAPPSAVEAEARPAHSPPAPPEPARHSGGEAPATTVNQFFGAGKATFVRGTVGDDVDDQRIATQIALVRSLVVPTASVVEDTDVDLGKGPRGWPARPILYGGNNLNAALQGLWDEVGLEVDAKRVRVGDRAFEGDDMRLIAVVPATSRHPQFVLFGGTGEAGVAEINAFVPMNYPIVVADRFGLLASAAWTVEGDRFRPAVGPQQRRIEYRTIERELAGHEGGKAASVRFEFPAMVPAAGEDQARVEAAMAGLAQVVDKLEIRDPVPLSVYVYPDRRSKQSLTGNGGDGHAVASSRTLHVVATAPDAMRGLVAHEGTHVLGYYALGPAATPMMGEGMAVWVSGAYGGKPVATVRTKVDGAPISQLQGRWKALPEPRKYPLAATAFEAAVLEIGLESVGVHLLPASADTWEQACTAAGTTAEAIEKRYEALLVAG